MDDVPFIRYVKNCTGAFARIIRFAFVVPLLPVIILNLPLSATPALVPGTPAVAQRAAPTGIGPGRNCPYVPVTLICIATGMTRVLGDGIRAPADDYGQDSI